MLKYLYRFIKWCILAFIVASISSVLYYKWQPVRYTPLMFIRCFQNFCNKSSVAIYHEWIPMSDFPRYMPVAVIASEDQNFLYHHGFDFDAIRIAIEEREVGKRERGASTISQQTAKNVFLWPNSSWLRKGFETYFTVLIELFWSKERIMEIYLNSIEMGPNIYGISALSQMYFGMEARELRRSDCALIAATLPNPIKFSSRKPSNYMRKRQKQIQRQMKFIPMFLSEK